MKLKKITCCVCGKEENPANWIESMQKELTKHQLCFTCNHWRKQNELDHTTRGEHGYAIVNGGHYTLNKPTNSYFKGFGGRKFKFEFLDGSVVECDNVWFQGNITDAHPHWREIMPDNAEIEW